MGGGNYLHILGQVLWKIPVQDFPSPKGAEVFHFDILKESFQPDLLELPCLFVCFWNMTHFLMKKSEKEELMIIKQSKSLVLGLVHIFIVVLLNNWKEMQFCLGWTNSFFSDFFVHQPNCKIVCSYSSICKWAGKVPYLNSRTVRSTGSWEE